MERRKFTRESKLEAVRLIKDRGVSYVQVSQDLNVHTSQLRDWVKKLSDDPQHAFPGKHVSFRLPTACRRSDALPVHVLPSAGRVSGTRAAT
jgi:transposase-like protein